MRMIWIGASSWRPGWMISGAPESRCARAAARSTYIQCTCVPSAMGIIIYPPFSSRFRQMHLQYAVYVQRAPLFTYSSLFRMRTIWIGALSWRPKWMISGTPESRCARAAARSTYIQYTCVPSAMGIIIYPPFSSRFHQI